MLTAHGANGTAPLGGVSNFMSWNYESANRTASSRAQAA